MIHEHINTQGRHWFVLPEAVVKGRPLRNPDRSYYSQRAML